MAGAGPLLIIIALTAGMFLVGPGFGVILFAISVYVAIEHLPKGWLKALGGLLILATAVVLLLQLLGVL